MAREGTAFDRAVGLVEALCKVAAHPDYIAVARRGLVRAGVPAAVAARDDRRLFGWLMDGLSFRGVADAVAARYIEVHGQASAGEIEAALQDEPACPKLRSYWHFEGCGYRKGAQRCGRPDDLASCPLPSLPLRNGQLNQMAFSLWLFMRDVAGGDLVGWIDHRLEVSGGDARAGLVEPLRHVHGIADKVLHMTLSDLLLAADRRRPAWVAAGAGLIAVDTLVHNWLHRSGILRNLAAEHPYGPACYGPGGCEQVLGALAGAIDARTINRKYPARFPRLVQHAIWRFCAQGGLDRCNGNRIDDRARCRDRDCPLYRGCGRVPLR